MSKSLIFCFDGTSNHPQDVKRTYEWFGLSHKIVDKSITNILKLHILFGGRLDNKAHSPSQHSFYYSGVGTYGSVFQQLLNATLAPESLDVSNIIRKAISDLQDVYKEGDRIYVFGFSRGAAIARRFCAVVHKYLGYDEPIYDLIDFIGVFDTVASIGLPNLDDENKPISDVVFENETISDNIKRALHLLSLDEERIAFQPTLMNAEKRVKEVWFSGSHSDIGGGYYNDGLSDVTLDYMIQEIFSRQLHIKILDLNEIDFDCLTTDTFTITKESLFINVDYLGQTHKVERKSLFQKATLANRWVRVNQNDDDRIKKPILNYSVKQRVLHCTDYFPKALENTSHYVETESGYIQVDRLEEYKYL